jgi:hypothetical protein
MDALGRHRESQAAALAIEPETRRTERAPVRSVTIDSFWIIANEINTKPSIAFVKALTKAFLIRLQKFSLLFQKVRLFPQNRGLFL